MSDWKFTVREVVAEPYAAVPQLTARLRIEETTGQVVHAIALRCQVRIEPQRRGYSAQEEKDLQGLFGNRERWSDTLRPFLWMQANATVQGFTDSTDVDLPLPCTYDFDVIGSRYLHALKEGAVPIELMFSGTIFTKGSNGFGIEQVPWNCDARNEMPVAVWRQLMETYYAGSGWLRMDHDSISALADYRSRHGLISWEETVARLLLTDDLSAIEGGGGA
jgi:hypothetical protein